MIGRKLVIFCAFSVENYTQNRKSFHLSDEISAKKYFICEDSVQWVFGGLPLKGQNTWRDDIQLNPEDGFRRIFLRYSILFHIIYSPTRNYFITGEASDMSSERSQYAKRFDRNE